MLILITGIWRMMHSVVAPTVPEPADAETGISRVSQPGSVGVKESAEPVDGHSRMVAMLKSVRTRKVYEHLFFGAPSVESEEAVLSTTRPSPQSRFMGLIRVANRRLWLGDTRKALKHLSQALPICEAGGSAVPQQIRSRLYRFLGLSWLRLGENENCVNCNNGESCLAPISDSGIHTNREGSEQAIVFLMKTLSVAPEDLTARWLLNIANMTLGQYPEGVPEQYRIDTKHFDSETEFPRFPNIAGRLGLNTLSCAGGCVVDDFDADGDLDVITSSWGEGDELQYFRNDKGKFIDDSARANFAGIFGGLNLLQADYDNDGDLDVLVLRGAWLGKVGTIPNSLLRNDGTGKFTDVTFDCGLAENSFPTQTAVWLDFDNDGDLDLFVGNEEFPCQLFENINGESFRDVAAQSGVENLRFTKGVTAGDYNDDGYPDIYVSNLQGENRLYKNNKDGSFVDVAPELNITDPIDGFPVWFWDYNQDGVLDIFASGYSLDLDCLGYEYFGVPSPQQFHFLYEGDGHGGFHEVADARHLNSHLPPMGANFGDLDNDGYPDLYLGTGTPQYEALMPNVMYRNQQGQRFFDVTTAGRMGHLQKGHGIAFADFDEDGDQDVFSEMGGAYPGDQAVNCVYENPGFGNHWLTLRLIGKTSNRSAIGAKVSVTVSDGDTVRTVYTWVGSGGSFGANPLRCEIGLGHADQIKQIVIDWPTSGTTQTFRDVSMDQSIEIEEGSEQIRPTKHES
ncbi:MAG: CRTAC1 family protein [Planctomycetaceae bacterium]|nr:CRTAC1 family protein [Planctomycetaceae bacterium]